MTKKKTEETAEPKRFDKFGKPKVGDVVRLRNDMISHEMLVRSVTDFLDRGLSVDCIWHDDCGTPQDIEYPAHVLEIVRKAEEAIQIFTDEKLPGEDKF
jgi:hypothetical protein